MTELKWDIKRGAEVYKTVYDSRIKKWISTGSIKRGEVLVWRSGLSGWRKPEELDELAPYFNQWEESQKRERRKLKKRIPPKRRQVKDILLIDDEKDLCWLLSNSLRKRGFNVAVATTRKEGMACLKEQTPDMIFLDLKLPDGDGMKVVSQARKVNPKTVVTVISAYGSEERREEAKRKGVFSFIDKPFTERDILRIIGKVQR